MGERVDRIGGILTAACALLVVGSFGPWYSLLPFGHPVRGPGCAVGVTLTAGVVGLVAAALLARRPFLTSAAVVALAAFVAAFTFGAFAWYHKPSLDWGSRVHWGLQAITLGGATGAVLAVVMLVRGESGVTRDWGLREGSWRF